jgi:hypothetical protein
MEKEMTFKDLYRFPGFRAKARLAPHPEHAGAWVVALPRRQKKRFARAAICKSAGTISAPVLSVTSIAAARQYTLRFPSGESIAESVTR